MERLIALIVVPSFRCTEVRVITLTRFILKSHSTCKRFLLLEHLVLVRITDDTARHNASSPCNDERLDRFRDVTPIHFPKDVYINSFISPLIGVGHAVIEFTSTVNTIPIKVNSTGSGQVHLKDIVWNIDLVVIIRSNRIVVFFIERPSFSLYFA